VERVVLIFAYHFPPENAVGGARPYRFCKYLSQMGYRCHVITAAEPSEPPYPDCEYVPDPFVKTSRKGIGWQLERLVRKFLMPGVTGIQWSRLACQAAIAFLGSNPDAQVTIFSTFPPLATHLAAFQLIRGKRLRWIADFRDPLHDNPADAGLTKFQRFFYRRFERAFFDRADIVIANTDAMAAKWKKDYPSIRDRVHLIWNGFDPEDSIKPQPRPHRDFQIISHVGELYRGRSVAPLLEAISRLIDAGRLQSGSVRVRLVGPMESDCLPNPQFLTRAKDQGWLDLIAHQVPPQEARSIAQTSDGLLLVPHPSPMQVPAKLFEYLRLGRPILAYVLPDSPIERILKQSGVTYSCVYAGSSPQEIDNSVESFFHLRADGGSANEWFTQNFDAKNQTKTLDTLIRSIHPRQGGTLEADR
jgi:glycosyltransferase involved in cell wall biosynthesis